MEGKDDPRRAVTEAVEAVEAAVAVLHDRWGDEAVREATYSRWICERLSLLRDRINHLVVVAVVDRDAPCPGHPTLWQMSEKHSEDSSENDGV